MSDSENAINAALKNLDAAYVPRALLEMAGLQLDSGRIREADELYKTATSLSIGRDPITLYQSLRMRAVIKAIDGDHRGALTDFKKLWPIAQNLRFHSAVHPYEILNSIALELGEVGRTEEGMRIIEPVLRASISAAFPAWRLTKADLASMQRRVFFPFSLALGAPARSDENVESQNSGAANKLESEATRAHPKTELNALSAPEAARDARPNTDLSRRFRPAPRMPIWIPLVPHLMRSSGSELTAKPTASDRPTLPSNPGYKISPPSRAPPAYDLQLF